MILRTATIALIGASLLSACGGDDTTPAPADESSYGAPAPVAEEVAGDETDGLIAVELPPIEEETLDAHISRLASDEFEGRAPTTKGGQLTRDYLIGEFERLGLMPANGESFEQEVGLVEQTVIANSAEMSFGGTELDLSYGTDYVLWSKQIKDDIAIDESELVFVGFGVVAPEYDWNDYEGLDVEGKTVVMLVNDPGFYLEDDAFNGRSMTYYGRWTYKFEEAARQGAAGAIIVHETDPAAYGWGVVEGSWTGPQLDLQRADDGASRVPIEGWITYETAQALFAATDMSYDEAKARALLPAFTPEDMGELTMSASMENVVNRNVSANIAGILPGTSHPDEYVLYMAHWDHLGKSFSTLGGDEGDTINNGAVDNATGTAGLLAIAESYSMAEAAPERSILFVAVTAEESGLLGSAYFAEDPLVPLNKIVGGINMDAIAPTGPAKDLIVVGYGKSELEDVLKGVADEYGKVLRPDASPERGYFYRSDHISLAKVGVPMIYVDKGIDLVDGGEAAGRAWEEEYTELRYHKPADNYDETWRLDGLAETVSILRDVGAQLAYSDIWPNWYEGDEFRSLRDAMMAEEQ